MRFLVAAALLAFAAPASAVTIAGLVNTGAGFALGTNGVDSNWTLFGGPAFVSGTNGVFPVATNWLADTTTSRWITPTSNAGDSLSPVADDNYSYTLTFSLAGLNPGTASFNGRYAADNLVTSILLNGNVLAASGGGFANWTAFGASSGFAPGVNTLTFNVTNVGQVSGNPSGLRVEFLTSDAAVVPEPANWAMLIAGFGLVGAAARRRRVAAAV
jgi:hypothetical protein